MNDRARIVGRTAPASVRDMITDVITRNHASVVGGAASYFGGNHTDRQRGPQQLPIQPEQSRQPSSPPNNASVVAQGRPSLTSVSDLLVLGSLARVGFAITLCLLCTLPQSASWAADKKNPPKKPSNTKQATNPNPKPAATGAPSLDSLFKEEEELRRKEEELLRQSIVKEAVTNRNLPSVRPELPSLPEPTPVAEQPAPPHNSPDLKATPPPAKEKATPAQLQPTPKSSNTPRVMQKDPASVPRSPDKKLPVKPVAPPPSTSPKDETPSKSRDPRDAEISLLRQQISVLSSRNREVEAELDEMRRKLLLSETEVERLNDFLNDQGRAYLDRATGTTERPRIPSQPPSVKRPSYDRLPRQEERPSPMMLRPSRSEPARTLDADQDVSIATVVSPVALGRDEANSAGGVIDQLRKGARVTVEQESNGWYRVLSPQGMRVWVTAKDLAFGVDGSVPPKKPETSSLRNAPSILPPQAAPADSKKPGGNPNDESRALEHIKTVQRQGQ